MGRAWRSTTRFGLWAALCVLGIALVGAASVILSGWLIDAVVRANSDTEKAAERSGIGDYFGGVNSVFSGIALILLVITLVIQQHELRLQRQELTASRKELRRSAEADLRSLHMQLTQMQMQDLSLADVWNDYPGETELAIRQNLFANLTFCHYLLLLKWESVSENEMLVHARDLIRSPAFRRYWAASRDMKASLPPDSDERRMFLIFERAMAEADHGTPPDDPDSAHAR